jgi:ribosome biogenesis ATPase
VNQKLAPSILFVDEIDAITPKRETAQREMERRIVAQLLTCMDGKRYTTFCLSQFPRLAQGLCPDLDWQKTGKPVVVIGATNRPDSLDPALRRAGRFDREIELGVPDEAGREQCVIFLISLLHSLSSSLIAPSLRILRALTSELRLSGDFDFKALARSTPGYVGADLAALTGVAGVIAVKRIFSELSQKTDAPLGDANGDVMIIDDAVNPTPESGEAQAADENSSVAPASHFSTLPPELASLPIPSFLRSHPDPLSSEQLAHLAITPLDFQQALSQVQPSSQREGFTTVPTTTWADVGALVEVRDELRMAVVQPIRRPELFADLGVESPCGVLLWGPPGCGKTLLARAVANESGANFIGVKGPELLNKVCVLLLLFV